MWAAILTLSMLFLRAVQPILLPFVLGILVAYIMDPLAAALERRKLSRSTATAVVMLGFLTLITALTVWLAPLLYEQFIALLSRAPEMVANIEAHLRTHAAPLVENLNRLTHGQATAALSTNPSALIERSVGAAGAFAEGLLASGAALMNITALLLITPIVCFYLIRDWPAIVRGTDQLLPLAYAPIIRAQILEINRTLAAYLRGQLVVMALMSLFYLLAFGILGLNFGIVLALIAGCFVIVPYIGSVISVGFGLLVAYEQFAFGTSLWIVVGIYGIGQILESQILTPKVIGDRVGLHPLWMLFGMLAGAVLLGVAGVLLAVPLTAVIGVLVKFAVRRYLESRLYREA